MYFSEHVANKDIETKVELNVLNPEERNYYISFGHPVDIGDGEEFMMTDIFLILSERQALFLADNINFELRFKERK